MNFRGLPAIVPLYMMQGQEEINHQIKEKEETTTEIAIENTTESTTEGITIIDDSINNTMTTKNCSKEKLEVQTKANKQFASSVYDSDPYHDVKMGVSIAALIFFPVCGFLIVVYECKRQRHHDVVKNNVQDESNDPDLPNYFMATFREPEHSGDQRKIVIQQ